jgi:hypothetical protein
MRIISIRTPQAKSFKYKPRYYDQQKEELEQRKATLGLRSKITHNEGLKLQMMKRWRTDDLNEGKSTMSKVITYLAYTLFIGGTVYFVMFTDIIEKLLSAFGVMK